ncbi:MAG: hypothetical protein HOP33_02755 [Verrucomicrobia bacterium]|nr:hypothetical protein [Verrucomicrobiota bacterium]
MNWEQLKTVFWLRWTLTRNQWRRSGGLGAVIAVVVGVGAVVAGTMSFAGGILGAVYGLREASPVLVMGVWAGITAVFLLAWLIGMLAELQRSETIDLQRLMHLPVALGQMFAVNYLTSHFAASIIAFVPAMIGLAIGLAYVRGAAMLLLLPLALSMVFMVTAWTYCLRGWLASMMTNPRRRRTIIMGITFAIILLAQSPNIYFNVIRRMGAKPAITATTPDSARQQRDARSAEEKKMFGNMVAAQKFIPPLWLPVGARALAEENAWPALLGTLGGVTIGALGLYRAYRSTWRFFHGETGGKAAVTGKSTAASPSRKAGSNQFLELRLPGVPEQAAALALATFRSMLRAPEVKMAWATSFIVAIIVGAGVFRSAAANVSDVAKPFIAAGVAAFSVFMQFGFLANQFGFDRDGFRALVQSPAERRLILLGRNLATLPVGVIFGTLMTTLVSIGLHLSMTGTIAALFQLATTLMLAGIAGNLLSILVPYRMQPGTMKPTKMPALAMLMMVLCQLSSPLATSPVMLPPLFEWLWRRAGWPGVVPVNLFFSMGLAGLAAFAYWQMLGPLGRLLQRRETRILAVVTAEVE